MSLEQGRAFRGAVLCFRAASGLGFSSRRLVNYLLVGSDLLPIMEAALLDGVGAGFIRRKSRTQVIEAVYCIESI